MQLPERGHATRKRPPLAAALAVLALGLAACDDNGNESGRTNTPPGGQQAQTTPPATPQTTPSRPAEPRGPDTAQPPPSSPGAAPIGARITGTWTVTESKGGPADGRSDRSETTTYRFEDGGRVTVAGSKQCAYTLHDKELKVDCNGQITAGKIEFRGDQTMVWTVGDQILTLNKR